MAAKSAKAIREELLDYCLKYARLDDADEDEKVIVSDLILPAALDYLEGAGVSQSSAPEALFKLVLAAMVLHDYDHRDDISAQQAYPLSLRLKINQLKIRGLATS